ncbi:MAG: PAS domain S-box protein [bacterium]|nr:PAS domain S-box protein [bacterium]
MSRNNENLNNDNIAFAAENEKPWKLIIADDEEEVQSITRMLLLDFSFMGRKLEILSSYSATETMELFKNNPDTALILLDIVMENNQSGYKVIRYIREKLDNHTVQIILRTGQAKHEPQKNIVEKYEINDYQSKTDLTAHELFTTLMSLFRAYETASSYEMLNRELKERNKKIKIMNELVIQSGEERRKSEELYRLLVETMTDGLVLVDKNIMLTYVNPRICELLEYSNDEMVGRYIFDFFDKPNTAILQDQIDRRKHGEEAPYEIEWTGKNGNKLSTIMSPKAIFDPNSNFLGSFAVITDITGRKRTEEKIKILNTELEQLVNQQFAELAEKNIALYESLETIQATKEQLILTGKMADLGNLVAGATHEISTPLGIGMTAATFLEEETGKISKLKEKNIMKRSDFDAYLEVATESSRILISNIRRSAELFRSFKIIAVDQCNEEKRKFKVREYIDEILLSMRPRLKKTEHEITIACSNNLEIFSYPGAFSQIISNLVINSLIHGFEQIQKGKIEITVTPDKTNLIVIYKDNGKGIEKKLIPKVFDQYFTTRRGKGGSGLGTYIIHNIVTEKLKGTITCESDMGKGVTFTVTMPL